MHWEHVSNGIIIGGALAYADARASCSVRKEKAFMSSEELDAVLTVEIQSPVAELWYTFGGIRLREYTFAFPIMVGSTAVVLASVSFVVIFFGETMFLGEMPFIFFGDFLVTLFTGTVVEEAVVPKSLDDADA